MYDKNSTEQSSKHSHSCRKSSTCPKHPKKPKKPNAGQKPQPICPTHPIGPKRSNTCPPSGCCNGHPIPTPNEEQVFTVSAALDNQILPTKTFPNNHILDGAPIPFSNIASSLSSSSIILNNGYIQIQTPGTYKFDFTVEIEENAGDFPSLNTYDSTVQLLMVVPSGAIPVNSRYNQDTQTSPAASPSVIILEDSSQSIPAGPGTIAGTYTVFVPKPNTLIALRNAFDGVRLILKHTLTSEISASMTITKVPSQ